MRTSTLLVMLAASGCVSRASCPPGDLSPPPREPRFAVLRSDFGSSAITLLDGDGEVIDDDWVDSGTAVASLVTSISGDVALPSSPLGGIAWIDRYAIDILTIATPTMGVVAQIDLRSEEPGSSVGTQPNAHDALRLDDGRYLVTRHNPTEGTGMARGNDVAVIDGDRIVSVIELGADAGGVPARPSQLLPLVAGDRRVSLVTLVRLASDYRSAIEGAALVLDETLTPSAPIGFGELENCGIASPDPDDASRAYVLCAGLLRVSDEMRRPHAGIVELTLTTEGTLEVTATHVPDAGMPTNGLVALGGRRVLAVSASTESTTQDRLLEIDLANGTSREIFRTERASFVLGEGVLDAVHHVALVPDAETGSILRVDATSGEVVGETPIESCVGLPPREIARL